MSEPAAGKQVGGVWLPQSEEHFVEMMLHNRKGARVVEGRHTYQYHKLEAALRHQPAERRRIAVDVGAHVGLWAMWLVRDFARVHAFEPVPAHAALFARNVEMTRASLHQVALGRAAGRTSITVPLAQTGGAHVASARGNPGTRYNGGGACQTWREVPLRTLDSFGLTEVDFIKIDVEGYERAVVEGARETIHKQKPNIVVEQKGNEAAYGEPRDAALSLLKSWGMKPLQTISGDHILGW